MKNIVEAESKWNTSYNLLMLVVIKLEFEIWLTFSVSALDCDPAIPNYFIGLIFDTF